MVVVARQKKLYSDDCRGKFGEPQGFGWYVFGRSRYGDINDMYGVYQRHTYNNRKVLSLHRDNFPANPRTTVQQAWRALFAEAMVAWNALDTETRQAYNAMVYPTGQYGVNRFITKYIKENR